MSSEPRRVPVISFDNCQFGLDLYIMLPHHSLDLPQGHQERQLSIPTAFDNLKITTPARHATHRRGLSFDPNMQCPNLSKSGRQEENTTTNQMQPQQIIPETQQRPMARPGQQRHNSDDSTLRPHKFPPLTDASTGCFKTDHSEQQIRDMTDDQIYELLAIRTSQRNIQHSLQHDIPAGSLDGDGYKNDMVATMPQENESHEIGLPDNQEASNRSSVHDSSIEPLRPCTPPTQTNRCLFPMTPDPTPHKAVHPQGTFQSASAHSSPMKKDANMTIKASQSMRRGVSYQDLFGDHTYTSRIPSPPASASLEPSDPFLLSKFLPSAFVDLSAMGVDFSTDSFEHQSSHCSPMSSAISPTMSSFQSSPELTMLPHPGFKDSEAADCALFPEPPFSASETPADFGGYMSSGKKSSHSRSQSAAGLDSGLTTVETGISSEEVNAFISGPHEDQKWTCMYPECGKRFGRKENIKSHVQTHLGDRQFLCIHCNKRFVRQHDLKRHEKIHTGIKPYPCECGHSFARMDALTRHKQRNTCVGGIGGPEGYEKRSPKRGRPRKHRPDTEERLEKASRTRQRVLEKQTASSVSGSSVCSFASPPPMADSYDTDASAAFPSPPEIYENYDTDASAAMSRETSSSHYGTLPALEPSSSSPAASRYFDFEDNSGVNCNGVKAEQDDANRDLSSSLVLTQEMTDLDRMLLEFNAGEPSLSTDDGEVNVNKHQSLSNNFDFNFVEEDPFGLSEEFLPPREDLSWALEGQ